MNQLFITATGTDIGKTMIAKALLWGAKEAGAGALSYQKPIQAGSPRDCTAIREVEGVQLIPSLIELKEPCSPDQGYAKEDLPSPSLKEIKDHLLKDQPTGFQVIEGAGGLLVPLNEEKDTWADLLALVDLPIVVVAQSGLGTLNHTSLTLEVMTSRGLEPSVIILNGPPHEANLHSLKAMHPRFQDRFICFPVINSEGELITQGSLLYQKVLSLCSQTPKEDWPLIAQKHIWYPFTQHQTTASPLPLKRAKGMWVFDTKAQGLLDMTGSWWVHNLGHGHKRLAQAMVRQHQNLDHTMLAGATHEGAARLAEKMNDLTDSKFPRCFFSDNGSTSLEVGLKMAVQWFFNQGKPRYRIASLRHSYHGDTFGAMALGQSSGFYQPFSPLLFQTDLFTPVTSHPSSKTLWQPGEEEKSLAEFSDYLKKHQEELAAIVIEPYVQGAGGMLIHNESWLKGICARARSYGVLVVFDEVFTGMGRLGELFAYQKLGFTPDILCLAKGVSGGVLPFALTLASEEVFAGFLHDDKKKAFLHGHSFTGNGMGCALALETLALYEEKGLSHKALEIEAWSREFLKSLKSRWPIENERCLGSVMAFEWPCEQGTGYFADLPTRFTPLAREHGLLMRPLGNTIYTTPPLTISRKEWLEFQNRLVKTLAQLEESTSWPS